MIDMRVVSSVARVRVLESHLHKKELFLNMLEHPTIDNAVRILSETGRYHADILRIKTFADVEQFFSGESEAFFQLALELFPDRNLFDAYFLLRRDLKKSAALILNTSYEFLKEFVRHYIDLYNIKTVLRLQMQKKVERFETDAAICGGFIRPADMTTMLDKDETGLYHDVLKEGFLQAKATGNFGIIERQIEDYCLHFLKRAKYMFYSPEGIFGYCFARESELLNLRFILTTIINGISPQHINERLCSGYA